MFYKRLKSARMGSEVCCNFFSNFFPLHFYASRKMKLLKQKVLQIVFGIRLGYFYFSMPGFFKDKFYKKPLQLLEPYNIICCQFHQHVTSAFFVQNFGVKNYKAVFLV
jgi:hypothetical protein